MNTKEARLWDRRIVLCMSCAELADKAKAELEAAHHRAQLQALMYLDQHIMRGALLASAAAQLPGLGKPGTNIPAEIGECYSNDQVLESRGLEPVDGT